MTNRRFPVGGGFVSPTDAKHQPGNNQDSAQTKDPVEPWPEHDHDEFAYVEFYDGQDGIWRRLLSRLRPAKQSSPDSAKASGNTIAARHSGRSLGRRSQRGRLGQAADWLWANDDVQRTVAVVNSKGGAGKTTLTTLLNKFCAWLLKLHPLAYDVNENSGHTHDRHGVPRMSPINGVKGAITNRLFIKTREQFAGNHAHFEAMVGRDRETGALVIASEEESNQSIEYDEQLAALIEAKRHVRWMFIDCGNGLTNPNNLATAGFADALIFAGHARSGETLDDIKSSQRRLKMKGLVHRVDNSLIVIVGCLPWETRKHWAKRFDWPIERVFTIPYSVYISKGRWLLVRKLRMRTKATLADILVAVGMTEAASDQLIDDDTESLEEQAALLAEAARSG